MDMSHMNHGMNNSNGTSGNVGGKVPQMEVGRMPMMMMQMTFYASKEVTLFFDGWKMTTAGELIGSCICLILIGILYEGLKVARQVLLVKSQKRTSSNIYVNPLISGQTTYSTNESMDDQTITDRMLSLSHFLQTFLHMLQVFMGYLLMLAFMTYNAWVCISVILGAGLGYFLFAWKSPSLTATDEHCN